MNYKTFVSTEILVQHLDDPDWVIVDCRFDLADPEWGISAYRQAHIPGAVYADLNRDLSGPVTPQTGRHPLPDPEDLRRTFGSLGIDSNKQVVAYDTANGSYAARLWCLLRMYGHDRVAVLEGDFNIWQQEGRPVSSGIETNPAVEFTGTFDPSRIIETSELQQKIATGQIRLIDARAPERFKGEKEPIDPVAGRIPTAVNRFHGENLTPDGKPKPAEQLRREFELLLENVKPEDVVVYCGSGVTSCFHLVAMEHAGISGARLYAGSWSEWIRDPNRPIATG